METLPLTHQVYTYKLETLRSTGLAHKTSNQGIKSEMWGYPSVNGYLKTVNLVGLPRHCCPVTCYSAAHALMTHGTGSRYSSTL